MELTKLHVISDFVSPVVRVPQVYNSLWKWGALILALIATFTSISTRIKLIIIRVRSIKRSSSKQLLQCFDDDFDFSDDEDDVDVSSTPDDDDESSDNSSVDGGDEPELRLNCFSWSDFSAGNSVVKLWDSFGLNLDFQDSSESENPTWGLDRDLKISDFFAGKGNIPAAGNIAPVAGKSSPAIVYMAEMSDHDRFVLGAYDRRISNDSPVVKWGPLAGGELRMRGLKNVRAPLNNLTESDVETWWDADAVIVS